MEAIHYALYGLALHPSKKASNEDIIAYGQPLAVVELAFSVDDREYTVKRVLKRRGVNDHELNIRLPDGRLDRVRGARDVNRRIEEELHGIDSEALLNSCLVEQKELGKLEASNRSERVKAMTSLLNLDAFVTAAAGLKERQKNLQLEHSETDGLLREAETSKGLYEEAERKRASSEKRLLEVQSELAALTARIAEIENAEAAIEELKRIISSARQAEARLQGLRALTDKLRIDLRKADEAAKDAEKLASEIPSAEERLTRAGARVEALESLLKLLEQTRSNQQRHQSTARSLGDAEINVARASDASRTAAELEERARLLAPAREAQSLLTGIEESDRRVESLRSDLRRLTDEHREASERINHLEGSEKRLASLDKELQGLEKQRSTEQRTRSLGLAAVAIGALICLAYFLVGLAALIGAPILLAGAIVALRVNLTVIDEELQGKRGAREGLIGEKARIDDFRGRATTLATGIVDTRAQIAVAEHALTSAASRLPSTPRAYGELKPLPALREAVSSDVEELASVTSTLNSTRAEAETLTTRTKIRDTLAAEKEALEEAIAQQQARARHMEEAEEVSAPRAKEIQAAKDEALRDLQRLSSDLQAKRSLADGKSKLETDLAEKTSEYEEIKAEHTRLVSDSERVEAEAGVSLTDEPRINREHREADAQRGSLTREDEERRTDIEEANHVMDINKALAQQHPTLVEKHAAEGAELQAIGLAVKLLDAARDGIMSGVKVGVETNMATFLPTLTDDRYNMVRIDEEKYQIEVYDREAKDWRSKGVFSGGAQDQFSLALRLAFALSTIPSTRGARPGFIFLDEPLSSFDSQRRTGFIKLIKEDLARSFDQIIVITHVEQIQDDFPNIVQLDAGRIVSQ